ncbi:BMP family ABC transporter substrate-binding protein [Borrelia turcica IST7]|uniref:BMP family ABC transporter substrate-binding protein n=1 Tax=Borrelia turcica IST7 TaxID=1104446 RepID=A0A386PKK0_9SPIR|nr:BMP family protein [Borrelia turcica]AYE36254.1 BMP family ABC transporter substrate-binding protein [Borrelia turcica IST7]
MGGLFLILLTLCLSCSGSKDVGGASKISMLIDGHFDDKSFNESAWMGAKKLGEDFGVEVIPKESTSSSYLADIEALRDNGSNFIWLIGYKLSNVSISVALENPDVRYAIIDPVYEDNVVVPKNLAAITFRTEEAAFLVGYIAAKTSKTGKIGFLGGIEGSIVDSFRFGYEAGAKYANRDISVRSGYIGSFADTETGRSMASKMYGDGIDVIYHAAGLGGLGAIEVAKEMGEGYYVIGVDQDQSYLAPDNIITSSIKDIGQVVYILTSNYLKTNAFEGGRILSYGLKEGFVGFVKNPKMIPFKLEKELDDVSDKIINGEITVPSNEKEYKVFLNEFL